MNLQKIAYELQFRYAEDNTDDVSDFSLPTTVVCLCHDGTMTDKQLMSVFEKMFNDNDIGVFVDNFTIISKQENNIDEYDKIFREARILIDTAGNPDNSKSCAEVSLMWSVLGSEMSKTLGELTLLGNTEELRDKMLDVIALAVESARIYGLTTDKKKEVDSE